MKKELNGAPPGTLLVICQGKVLCHSWIYSLQTYTFSKGQLFYLLLTLPTHRQLEMVPSWVEIEILRTIWREGTQKPVC